MKIIALIMSFIIALTSCSIPVKAYDAVDVVRDTVRVIDKNIKNAVDTVEHATDMVWNNINATIDYLTVKRKTNYPTSDYNQAPSYTTNYNDYTCNYYTVDNNTSSDTYSVENNSYTSNSYYNYNTYNYTTTNNVSYITNTTNNYDYYTYQYEFNDNRVFITEAYNCVVYTYVNPETKTVDCYMCSFEMPNGDSSFNYSSGYCYGLYWVYDVVNYDYELDDSSVLAYWRFDGDLHNEIPDSPITFNYSANEFGSGKFGDSLRCNGPYQFYLHGNRLPTNLTIDCWYYNGDTQYKGDMSIGWHNLVWVFRGTDKTVYIDGVKTTSSNFSQYTLIGDVADSVPTTDGKFRITSPFTRSAVMHVDCYNPDLKGYYFNKRGDYDGNIIGYGDGSTNTLTGNPIRSLLLPSDLANLGSDSTFVKGASNGVSPFHYPPIRRSDYILFPYTGSCQNDTGGYALAYVPATNLVRVSDKGFITTINTDFPNYVASALPIAGSNMFNFTDSGYTSLDYWSRGTEFRDNVVASSWTQYDLSNCYFDDMIVYSGVKYDADVIPMRFSRLELEIGYTVPSYPVSVNTIGLQSPVKCNNFRVGGVIPTVTHHGDVWFKLRDGYCVDCLQYIDGSWQSINFGVYDGESWVNGYTYNFYQLSFDTIDADSGTNSSVIYNYYYSGDNIYNDYFVNSATDDEKNSVFSFITSLIGTLGTLFVFIGGALPLFSFMPTWAIGLLFTFLPVCSILIIISITKHFLGGKK